MTLRELGSLQREILKYLTKKPESHKQQIQIGIEHNPYQYASVKNATDSLEEQEYIKSKKALSEKNLEIKLYSCTEKGLLYILTRNPEIIMEIAEIYKENHPEFTFFQSQCEILGRDLFVKFFKLVGQSVILYKKDNLAKAIWYAFTAPMSMDFSPEEQKQIRKSTLKGLPSKYRKIVSELAKRMSELDKSMKE